MNTLVHPLWPLSVLAHFKCERPISQESTGVRYKAIQRVQKVHTEP